MSSSATRSPLIDRSICSLRLAHAAEQLAGRRAVQHDAERVVAVGREGVVEREAAARAPRRAVDVPHLRLGARHLDGELRRARVAVADRERRDLAGGAQVAFHQRRRERLHVGDVVVAGAQRVGRQERVDVDVEVEQVVDRARVLGAVQTLEAAGVPGSDAATAALSILVSSDADELRRAPRRRAGARLAAASCRARSLWMIFSATSGVLLRVRGIERDQRQSAGLALIAVAADAILLRELRLSCRFRR